ncbi:insulinase family protein [Vibrio methylphosphonaticus]|uniref:insulinase family protein n=1 Tax=Vibrio methylphosphonaticus TaxID=2946866 RepID=UPI00202AC143|nr:insulinase family protein [Vibrio methylphosphonaticus]MCL9774535.1 insulinase family protein [Vibrio methylphosphonaticus]
MHLSPNDNRSYRILTLDNAMQVLLIEDQQAQKSAVALAVNVGHFDDPSDREGLAHYLEHMLFLGTEKYPKVGEFQSFVNQHGGSNNAWTGTEHSCFFFDIYPNAFERGLDRFSQFFSAPLFNEEALDKERQAVDSEYKLKLHDDGRRLYQVQKETINPAHPFAKFSVGNLDTLSDRNGQSIRDEILHFHQQQYSADLMTLALIGPHSLDELQQWVESKFDGVINQQRQDKRVDVPFMTAEETQKIIRVEPIKEIRRLILAFPMPATNQYYHSKPLSYFANLLGHEGEGSLMLYLKNKGWITSLSAGGGASGSNFREFSVSMTLTPQGLEHSDDIIASVFQFIALIKTQGMQEWRHLEKRAVMESAFQFQEPARPLDLVSHLVMNMQNYQVDDIMYGDYKMADYDESLIRECGNYLTASNLKVTLVAKEQTFDKSAKWYFTPYSVAPFTDQQQAMFSGAERTTQADVLSSLPFSLPNKNPFIIYDLSSYPAESNHEFPVLLEDLDGFRLWHLQDHEFNVPKGVVFIAIDSPHSVSTPRNIVKTRLCVEMFLDSLSEETYEAEVAGLNYDMYAHQGGVTLSISGFSKKQPQLLNMILQRFASREFNRSRYESIKAQLLRSWNNASKDRPISQLFNQMSGILQPNNPPYPVLIEALETIDVDELPAFVQSILSELHIDMFVYGDWQRQGAIDIAATLKDALRLANQKYEESLRPLVMLGKNGSFQREMFCDQEDSAIVVYHQCDDISPRSIALYTLANHLMSATFFHEIRTKQQLGYMVGTGNMPLNRHPGIVLYVQSPKAAPSELIRSIDEFLNAFYMVLFELDDYQWHSSKKGLWNQISTPDTTLRGRAQRLWVAIGNKDTEFNQREKVLEELKTLTRADMIRFVVNELKPRTANRLIMHSLGKAHSDAPRLNVGLEIGSIDEFQLRPKDTDLG